MQKDTIEAIYFIGTAFMLGLVIGLVLFVWVQMKKPKHKRFGYNPDTGKFFKVL